MVRCVENFGFNKVNDKVNRVNVITCTLIPSIYDCDSICSPGEHKICVRELVCLQESNYANKGRHDPSSKVVHFNIKRKTSSTSI